MNSEFRGQRPTEDQSLQRSGPRRSSRPQPQATQLFARDTRPSCKRDPRVAYETSFLGSKEAQSAIRKDRAKSYLARGQHVRKHSEQSRLDESNEEEAPDHALLGAVL
jgi:hypothetical protein